MPPHPNGRVLGVNRPRRASSRAWNLARSAGFSLRMQPGRSQGEDFFLGLPQPLDLPFSHHRRTLVAVSFLLYQRYRTPLGRVDGTGTGIVLLHSSVNVFRNSRVDGAISAAEKVDIPGIGGIGHSSISRIVWEKRRGRDSNPGAGFPANCLAGSCLKPTRPPLPFASPLRRGADHAPYLLRTGSRHRKNPHDTISGTLQPAQTPGCHRVRKQLGVGILQRPCSGNRLDNLGRSGYDRKFLRSAIRPQIGPDLR